MWEDGSCKKIGLCVRDQTKGMDWEMIQEPQLVGRQPELFIEYPGSGLECLDSEMEPTWGGGD